MPEKTMFEELIDNDEMAKMVAQEKLILSATEAICAVLKQNNVTRSELAKRLGKTKGYVSQVLGGSRNITLRTLSDIMHCLGCSASINIDNEERKRVSAKFVDTWDTRQDKVVHFNQPPDDYLDCEPIGFEKMVS